MAPGNKRKIDEGRMFQKEWTNSYFLVEISDKPVCLVCGKHVAAKKKSNLECHYDSFHGYVKKLTGQVRTTQDKIDILKRELRAQQTALQWYCKTDSDIIGTSYEISELNAKKVKPYVEGEFVKECLITAAKLLAPDKITLFQKVSLSRKNISDQIQEMGDDIEKTLKARVQHFEFLQWPLMTLPTSQIQPS